MHPGGGGATDRSDARKRRSVARKPKALASSCASGVEQPSPKQEEPIGQVEALEVVVHGTDLLKASYRLSSVLVRVTLLDEDGSHTRKSADGRCATSYYEKGNPLVDYILPVLTQPCSGVLQPAWEESLVFNEHPSHFPSTSLVFFEVLGLPPSSSFPSQSSWLSVAWAFFRPFANGRKHFGQKKRLQLFKYPKQHCQVYDLWNEVQQMPYPSTLYVTVRTCVLGSAMHPSTRSFFPTQKEEGSMCVFGNNRGLSSLVSMSSDEPLWVQRWPRLRGQSCCPPNTLLHSTSIASGGASVLAFSACGRLLAVGCAEEDHYPIVVMEVASRAVVLRGEGHRGLVYCLSWSPSGLLGSASADGLVKLWCVGGDASGRPMLVLPHPCYVYAVRCASNREVFTGAYDHSVRLWRVDEQDGNKAELAQEMRGHSQMVNALEWDAAGMLLYSGDSAGCVCIWHASDGRWELSRKVEAVNGQPLMGLSLHPQARKLLLHTAPGPMLLLDLRIDKVCQRYPQSFGSSALPSSSLLTPCGTLVMCGGVGEVKVWSVDSGEQLPPVVLPSLKGLVCALDYHPSQHLAAFSSLLPHQPLLLMAYSPPPTASLLQHQQQQTLDSVASARVRKLEEASLTLQSATTFINS